MTTGMLNRKPASLAYVPLLPTPPVTGKSRLKNVNSKPPARKRCAANAGSTHCPRTTVELVATDRYTYFILDVNVYITGHSGVAESLPKMVKAKKKAVVGGGVES